ncbi:MAG: DUF1064 domain-containing protein [Erysipelotrichia bacterium]|nr:DUF1064 domain-containing protein [Erysipelotrichia bacterium]
MQSKKKRMTLQLNKFAKAISRKKKVTKVNNATPNEFDGIKFKSKLETYTYQKLQENGIHAVYEGERFTLIPAFNYQNEAVRAMTYLPDFVGKDFVIECKGFGNDAFPLRWKIFKYTLFQQKANYKLYLVKNKKDVDQLIENLKN